MTTPERPEGVVLITSDGVEIPCDLRYLGYNNEGHLWQTVAEVDFSKVKIVNVKIAKLPAHTGIQFPYTPHMEEL